MEFIKKNKTLVLGLSIPVIMVILVALSIYLPSLFVKPQYDFVYTTDGYYNSDGRYSVEDGMIVRRVDTYFDYSNNSSPEFAKLYLYDVSSDTSEEIQFSDAQHMQLDSSPKSPDGLVINSGGSSGGFFPFFSGSSDYNSEYLVGNGISRKLNVQINGSSYDGFQLVGWVK